MLETEDSWQYEKQKMCIVTICNDREVVPVEYMFAWGDGELPRVDQRTNLGVGFSRKHPWEAHMRILAKERKVRVGNLHLVLIDYRLDSHIKTLAMKSVIIPPLECAGEASEGSKKVVKEIGTGTGAGVTNLKTWS